eukprot:scaffold6951_cov26-Phaeocystis_antarctica.AAC.1
MGECWLGLVGARRSQAKEGLAPWPTAAHWHAQAARSTASTPRMMQWNLDPDLPRTCAGENDDRPPCSLPCTRSAANALNDHLLRGALPAALALARPLR